MDPATEELVATLLFEGYALYPYTPSATKNATPTPFGIVYPPAYAAESAGAHDRLRMHAVAQGDGSAVVAAQVRFLRASGPRHEAVQERLSLEPRSLAELHAAPLVHEFSCAALSGRLRCSAEPLGPALWRVALCVHNVTRVEPGLDRASALAASLLSTHPILELEGGSFASPLERDGILGEAVAGCESVNTFPVLTGRADDVLLGAQIVLPDHPQLAPESRGSLFDGTEIEEALLLHVLALSDSERSQIAAEDPAVREMVARAAAATPEDLLALHGRTVLSDPAIPGEAR